MAKQKLNILIATGGTGGHLLPAQKLADSLRNNSICGQITLAGLGLNKKHFFDPDRYQIYEVSSGSLSKNPIRLFHTCVQVIKGVYQTYRFLRKNPVDIVVGFGSYHAFPVLLAAKLLRKKILLYEQNTVLGQVNRIFASSSEIVALQLPLEKLLKNGVFVNFPPKKSFCKKNVSNKKNKTMLIFGGSQGADFLNRFFLNLAPQISGFRIIHLTGNDQMTAYCRKNYEKHHLKAIVQSYESDIAKLYRQSDFAVCRAGSNTVQELIYHEIPAILVPYPFAKDQHQHKNGLFFQNIVRGGVCMEQHALNIKLFLFLLGEFVQSLPKYCENIHDYNLQHDSQQRQLLSELILQIGAKE